MKALIINLTLLFAILSNVNGQNQFGDYVNYLKESEVIIQQPDPKKIQPHERHLFPRPLVVKRYSKKVVVVFDRKEWEAFQYLHRKMWMRRGEVKKQIDELRKYK